MNLVERIAEASRYRKAQVARVKQRRAKCDHVEEIFDLYWRIDSLARGSTLEYSADPVRFAKAFKDRAYRCYRKTDRVLAHYGM